MEKLQARLNELETHLPHAGKQASRISSAPIGWHIEHTLLVANVIIGALKRSDPKTYQWKFNWARTIILPLGLIPRGKIKAPESVRPKESFDASRINGHFNQLRENIATLNSLHKDSYFLHPFFGNLNIKPTIKFLEVHTHHHLKIIRDILKESKMEKA